MKKQLQIMMVCLALPTASWAQQYYSLNLGPWQDVPCPYDPDVTVHVPNDDWQFYFTQDNTWDGPVDSTLCVSFYITGTNIHRLDTVDWPAGKRLFLSTELNSTGPFAMPQDWVYMVNPPFMVYGCDSAVCNRALVRQHIPDPTGATMIDLDQELVLSEMEGNFCHVTEKFETHEVAKVYFSYERPNSQAYLQVYTSAGMYWQPSDWVEPLLPLNNASPDGLGSYSWYAESWVTNLIRHHDTFYPAPDSISYTEFIPSDDPTDSAQIVIQVEPYTSFHFQRHTALQGTLVNGSDSVRHSILLNLQGTACLAFVEVMWEGDNQLVVDGGQMHFHDQRACNQFGRGGRLTLKSGTRLEYGQFGAGMLALRTGAELVIEPGAELVMKGTVVMDEYGWEDTPKQIYIDLVPGAKLTFAAGSHISNEFALDRHMRLNVRMLGGMLDDSGLSEDERGLINRIYAYPSTVREENLSLFPNPVDEEVNFIYVSSGSGELIIATVSDIQGRTVYEQHIRTRNQGHNTFNLPMDQASPGLYTLSVTTSNGTLTRRFSKAD